MFRHQIFLDDHVVTITMDLIRTRHCNFVPIRGATLSSSIPTQIITNCFLTTCIIMLVTVIWCRQSNVQKLVILRQQKKAVASRNNYRDLQAGACASLWQYCSNTFTSKSAIRILISTNCQNREDHVSGVQMRSDVHYASSDGTLLP